MGGAILGATGGGAPMTNGRAGGRVTSAPCNAGCAEGFGTSVILYAGGNGAGNAGRTTTALSYCSRRHLSRYASSCASVTVPVAGNGGGMPGPYS